MNHQALLIAYYYPPDPASGSNRAEGLSRCLPEYGWDVTVVTATYPGRVTQMAGTNCLEVADPGILADWRRRFPGKVEVKSVAGRGTAMPMIRRSLLRQVAYEVLCYPDSQLGWRKPCWEACRSYATQHPIDMVLTTSMPVTSHLVGRDLKRAGLIYHWVADLRDLWTQNHYREKYSRLRDWLERRLEKRTLASADCLVTTSEPWAQTLGDLHPLVPIESITNGFQPSAQTEPVVLAERFTLVYTGVLYAGRRDPRLLFEALHVMLQRNLLEASEIEVRFIGDDLKWLREMIETYGLQACVTITGRVPRVQARQEQRRATALLLLNWDHPAEVGTYTGKVFEYLDVQRPILALGGPSGVLSTLLTQTRAGIHVFAVDEVVNVLQQWLIEFRATGQVAYQGLEDKVQAYSWSNLARHYATVLDQVLTK
jgi:glycosyltransferase involved in cell wall biosynthesis